jgi:CheY-like chemotaxis protein/signal transduction histidine kinase
LFLESTCEVRETPNHACKRMPLKQKKKRQSNTRSVEDYETYDSLQKALVGSHEIGASEDVLPVAGSDWVLPSFDPASTEAQSMKEELHRLQVLKSYLILDADREESFDRITGLAGRFFDVPIALVSLVDMGRQWFMSNRGLEDVQETPRKHAFCAHAILNKHNMLVVPDATKDFRFCDNPLVTGAPHVRFYAGAPLLTPEGVKIGTLCLISDRPRPRGMSESEQESLHDLAKMTVQAMVDRRTRLQRRETSAELMAWTAHDLVTPVTGIHLSLSLLEKDDALQSRLDPAHQELLKTASHCAEMMVRMCQSVVLTMRQRESCLSGNASVQLMPSSSKLNTPCTNMADLLENLNLILKPIPKQVPVILTLDASVPTAIVCDDLVLFRSALNLLSHAVSRTATGSIRLKIYPLQDQLCFECEDTGPDIIDGESLFQPGFAEDGSTLLELSSIATQIHAIDGEYGFWPRTCPRDGNAPQENRQDSGSVFWFRVPLVAAESLTPSFVDDRSTSTAITGMINDTDTTTRMKTSHRHTRSAISNTSELSLVVGDISQVEALENSCQFKIFEPSTDYSEVEALQESLLSEVFEPSFRQDPGNIMAGNAVLKPWPKQKTSSTLTMSTPNINWGMNSGEKMVEYENEVPPVSPSPIEMTGGLRKKRALVIEDSCVVRKSLVRALERLGFIVLHAANGMEGLELLKQNLFDLVLCDFLMPVMDGMDCVKQYREWELGAHPLFRQWIVGISAHANVSDQDQGLKAGMDEFHPKPISIKTLTEIQQSDVIRTRSQMLDEMAGSRSDPMKISLVASSSDVVDTSQVAKHENSRGLRTEDGSVEVANIQQKKLSESSSSSSGTFTEKHEHQICLVGMRPYGAGVHSSKLLTQMAMDGWQIVIVPDGESVLHNLRKRNWDAVLIDDDIPILSSTVCITEFRKWEKKYRVNGQRNIFLICNGDIPSPFDKTSMVQPPSGFDNVLGKPVEWNNMKFMITEARGSREFDIIVREND